MPLTERDSSNGLSPFDRTIQPQDIPGLDRSQPFLHLSLTSLSFRTTYIIQALVTMQNIPLRSSPPLFVRIREPPRLSSIQVVPESGTEMLTLFNVTCLGAFDPSGSSFLRYRIEAVDRRMNQKIVLSITNDRSSLVRLPVGLESNSYIVPIICTVMNDQGSRAEVTHSSTQVLPDRITSVERIVSRAVENANDIPIEPPTSTEQGLDRLAQLSQLTLALGSSRVLEAIASSPSPSVMCSRCCSFFFCVV